MPIFSISHKQYAAKEENVSLVFWSLYFGAEYLSPSKLSKCTVLYRAWAYLWLDVSTAVGLLPLGQRTPACFLFTSLPGLGRVSQMGAVLTMSKIEKYLPLKAKTDGEVGYSAWKWSGSFSGSSFSLKCCDSSRAHHSFSRGIKTFMSLS